MTETCRSVPKRDKARAVVQNDERQGLAAGLNGVRHLGRNSGEQSKGKHSAYKRESIENWIVFGTRSWTYLALSVVLLKPNGFGLLCA